ncbi:MAG TPA: glycosyl hydrolase [Acetobacteraceae bacterium]|jgi:hypothetical protein|nr:glycosyl hydrolase [Acetobacteraceae bacterium]
MPQTLLGADISQPGSPTWATDLSSFTAAMGQAPAIVDTFVDWSSWGSVMDILAQWSAGVISGMNYLPVVGVPMATNADSSADSAFRAIASGAHDSDFEAIFQGYVNAGFKAFDIRPGWEFDGTWFPWSVTPSNQADFVAAFDHIAALAHSFSGATIKVIWEPNGGAPYNSGMYPGNQAVDIIGIDQFGYGAVGTANSQVFQSDGSTWSYTTAAQMAVANGKPLSADEVTDTPADTPQYAANVAQALTSVPGLVVDHFTLVNDPSQEFWADDAAAAAAWRQAFAAISAASGASAPATGTTASTAPAAPSNNTGSTASIGYITPGSGSFTDGAGNVYTIDSASNADRNGSPIPNGSGTGAMEYYNGTVYGQDARSGQWYALNQSTWSAASAPPSPTSVSQASASPANISIGANEASTTINQSSATVTATSGNHSVFLYGSNDTIQMSGGAATILEIGSNNTFVLPKVGEGYDWLIGPELTNGDTFDFRSALAATNWDGNSGELSNYLQVATDSSGNTRVSISATAGGSANPVLVLDGVTASMSQILAHSIA